MRIAGYEKRSQCAEKALFLLIRLKGQFCLYTSYDEVFKQFFLVKYLRMSKKSSTFAADLQGKSYTTSSL